MNQLMLQDNTGRDVLVLVLEPGNIHKLVNLGQPIELRLEDNYPDGIPRKLTLVIAHSETPIADAKQFRKMSKMTFDERTPQSKSRPHCPQCRSTIEQLGVWRNESPLAIAFCVVCGCSFGMVPQEVTKQLQGAPAKDVLR